MHNNGQKSRHRFLKLNTKHYLTGEELSRDENLGVLDLATNLKRSRGSQDSDSGMYSTALSGKSLAMLFEKPSLRTRVSFTVAMQELGGNVIESVSSTSKKEEPEDVAQVLSGYVHGVMLRTHAQSILDRMAKKSKVPVINGLSDMYHPCQALADAMTLQEVFGSLKGLKVTYIGDGNNVLHSLMILLPSLGAELRYSCPSGYEPSSFVVKRAKARAKEAQGALVACPTPKAAILGSNAVYTDVWASMGFEDEEKDRIKAFQGYQLNAELMKNAAANAIVMHCLPMVRDQEITSEIADGHASRLFQQSENRLHTQKALLLGLLQ